MESEEVIAPSNLLQSTLRSKVFARMKPMGQIIFFELLNQVPPFQDLRVPLIASAI